MSINRTGHDPTRVPRPRRAVRFASLGTVAALALGSAIIGAPNASAATIAITAGTLDWGIKSTLQAYATTKTPSEGATVTGTSPAQVFHFGPATGGYDTVSHTVTSGYAGKVRLEKPAHGVDFSISNPKVVIATTGATLNVDYFLPAHVTTAVGPEGPAGTSVPATTLTNIPVLGLAITGPGTSVGDVTTYTNIATSFLATGTQVFGDNYNVGDAFDPVTFSFTLPSGGGGGGGGSGGGGGTGDPMGTPHSQTLNFTMPAATTGEFRWTGPAGSTVSMGAPSASSGGFVTSTGALNTFTVTDTRSGSAPWTVNGVVTDFTSTGGTISGTRLGWEPAVTGTPVTGVTPGATVAPGDGTTGGLKTSKPLATAAATHGSGPATVGGGLTLKAPDNTPAGAYSATMTLSAIS